jgi:hypothetical protein
VVRRRCSQTAYSGGVLRRGRGRRRSLRRGEPDDGDGVLDRVQMKEREVAGIAGASSVRRPHGVAAEQSKKRGEEVRRREGKGL